MRHTIPMPSLERQIKELRAYIEEAERTGKYPWRLSVKLDKWRDQFKPSYSGTRHTLLDDATLDAWIARQKAQYIPQATALLDGLTGLYMERIGAGDVKQETAPMGL